MESVLLDVAGHRRSPATMPGYHRGRAPRNTGEQYPADRPTVEEIVAVMRSVGDRGAWTAVADDFGQRRPSDEAIERTATGSAWRLSADPLSHPRLAKRRTRRVDPRTPRFVI